MLFRDFSLHLHNIEQISARLEITAELVRLYQEILNSSPNPQEEIVLASYLLQGSLLPSYQSLDFQMSEKMLLRTLAAVLAVVKQSPEEDDAAVGTLSLFAATDHSSRTGDLVKSKLQQRYKQLGDMGELFLEVVEQLQVNNPPTKQPKLTEVYQALTQIALSGGTGSQEQKIDQLSQLLLQLDPLSAKYVSRIILSKLRLGFSTMTLLDALSFVKHGDKTDSALLERILGKKADLGKLALAYLLEHRQQPTSELLDIYEAEVGVPIQPVLCQRLNSAAEIIDKMGPVIAEPKYDGLRVQVHFKRGGFVAGDLDYRAFTRNLEDVTHMFPELAGLGQQLSAEECILDAEAIGIDQQTGGFLAFQDTIQRKRKHNVSAKAAEVPLCFFVFDLLWLDGTSYLDQPLTERKAKLAQIIRPAKFLQNTAYELIADPEQLRQFHEQQLALGLEGAVMKQPNSAYVAGRKSWRWVKIKEEEGSRGKLSDTVDCVMMGYYLGKGKRQQFGLGAILVGVLDRDPQGEVVVKSLSKIGTGFSDEQFQQIKVLTDACRSTSNRRPAAYEVDKTLFPDIWLEPQIVLEVAADELSRSPIHAAGVALRFPRLLRVRSDKQWTDATTVAELTEIKIGV